MKNATGVRLKPPAAVEKIARALLYEGYLLYPYRRSALKNRHRWNFGVLYPANSDLVTAGVGLDRMQIECLVVPGPCGAIGVTVRFLQLGLKKSLANNEWDDAWHEALEREVTHPDLELASLDPGTVEVPFVFDPSQDAHGSPAIQDGSVLRQEIVHGVISVRAERLQDELCKLSMQIRNVTACDSVCGAERDRALMKALVSTHVILQVSDGEFISLLEPPDIYREAAAECHNIGAWPVLAGAEGERNCMLASPIILYDYPKIAPESPGDLFDGTEIDKLLTLRILTLTEEEKQEIHRGDFHVREIRARSEALPGDQLLKMHGAVRGLKAIKEVK